MNTHSNKLILQYENKDENNNELPLDDSSYQYHLHESLKVIFHKHGVNIEHKFFNDLNEWKLS